MKNLQNQWVKLLLTAWVPKNNFFKKKKNGRYIDETKYSIEADKAESENSE